MVPCDRLQVAKQLLYFTRDLFGVPSCVLLARGLFGVPSCVLLARGLFRVPSCVLLARGLFQCPGFSQLCFGSSAAFALFVEHTLSTSVTVARIFLNRRFHCFAVFAKYLVHILGNVEPEEWT